MAFGKFGRYYPDGIEVRAAPFDLMALLRDEVAVLAASDPGAARIRLRCEPARLIIGTDATHVRYIVVNLLQNALKYSPGTKPVECDCRREGDSVRLVVRDHGIGVPAEELSRLFSPFYRASNVGDRPGTGMGLAIVKRSAQLIGARLDVHSDGAGSVFTVLLRAGPE
jgi:hypothetical protein